MVKYKAWPVGSWIGCCNNGLFRFLDIVQWTIVNWVKTFLRKIILRHQTIHNLGRNMRHITEFCISARPRFLLMIGDDAVDGNADIVKISW